MEVIFRPGLLTRIVTSTTFKVRRSTNAYVQQYYPGTGYQKIYRSVAKFDSSGLFLPRGLVSCFLRSLKLSPDELTVTDEIQDEFTLVESELLETLSIFEKKGVTLRSYQDEALRMLLAKPMGIVAHPTGSGKGEIIVAAAHLLQRYGQVLVLVFTSASLKNTTERFERYGVPYSVYHDVRPRNAIPSRIVISTPGVIYNDLISGNGNKFLSQIKYVLSNEVHHARGNRWYESLLGLQSVIRSYGFSATSGVSRRVLTINDMTLEEARVRGTHGEIVHERKSQDEEVRGHLSRLEILNIIYDPPWLGEDRFCFDSQTIRKYIRHPDRLEFIARLVQIIDENTEFSSITFVSERTQQGDILLAQYPKSSAAWYGGGIIETNNGLDLTLDSIFDAIIQKEIRHTIVTSHAREDINLPVLNFGILVELAGERTVKQCVGRIVRPGSPSFVVNLYDQAPLALRYQARKRLKQIIREYGGLPRDIRTLDEFEHIVRNFWKRFREAQENDLGRNG